MEHSTPEQLALAALREPLPAADTAHLEECGQCRAEVASLRRGVELLAVPEFAAPGPAVAPPPAVWASIAAATGVSAAPRPERVAATTDPVPAAEPVAPPSNVVPLRRRGPSTWLIAVAAAVAGAVIGAGAVAVLQGDDDGAELAAASLAPLADADAAGSARVVERSDGTRVLELELDAPDLEGAYYEVWLLKPDVSGLVPVGTAQAGSSQFEIPVGLDLGQFPVVDVSVEQLDGDPNHSGDSVVRGELDT